MAKKKKKKVIKKKPLMIIIIVSLLLIAFIFATIYITSISNPKIIYKNNNKVGINTKIYNTDNIKKINNGKLVTKKKLINTKKLGKQTITIKVKNKFNRIKTYKYKIEVIDKEKPVITAEEKITIEQGTEIDLKQGVAVTDNSNEKIEIQVEGEYDINTPGTYELKYIATDSSKNKEEKSFILEVIEKQVQQNNNGSENRTYKTAKGYTVKIVDGIAYINGTLIANKTYSLPSDYNPGGLTAEFNNAFSEMQQAANAEGIGIWVISGFRSYNTQNTLYNNYAARDGYEAADTYSARPGHSEHQTGLAADINDIDDYFDQTPAGAWLYNNAWKYGFILRYTRDGTSETGYKFEPWHYRYVGKDLAEKLYNGGNWITLENYFGITSQYS